MDAKPSTWEPLLSGSQVETGLSFINGVTEAEKNCLSDSSCIELCDRALYLTYLWRSAPSSVPLARILALLEAAGERVSVDMQSGLFYGLSAIGWTMQHIVRALSSEMLIAWQDDPLEDLDHVLRTRLYCQHWKGPFDLVDGLTGIGVFYLERLPRPTAYEGLYLVINHLESTCEESVNGICWRTKQEMIQESQRAQYPLGYFNLGVAHGTPGVIGFLGCVLSKAIDCNRTERLLRGAVRWLLSHEDARASGSHFPTWIIPDRHRLNSRLSWCYGDLSIAAILWQAGTLTNEIDWQAKANGLFESCTLRINEVLSESGLCHGALGIAHIYNRIYQHTRQQAYATLAAHYYHAGLSILSQKQMRMNFLKGSLGAALTLLSACKNIEPAWDRRLLLSCPS